MPGKLWMTWQVETLKKLLARGFSAREMRIGARTAAAIQNKASRLNLVGDGIPRPKWPAELEQTLRSLRAQGWTAQKIAQATDLLAGYSRNAIVKKSSRLGLVDKVRSERAKRAVRLSPEQLWQFYLFLRAHAATCTPEQIALLWNKENEPRVSRRRVVYHLVKLKIKRPWNEVIKMPFSKAKQRRLSEQAAAGHKRRWAKYREKLLLSLRERAHKLREHARKERGRLKERICKDCKRRWPARQPFFAAHSKETRFGRRMYLARICKLCQNQRRRTRRTNHSPTIPPSATG